MAAMIVVRGEMEKTVFIMEVHMKFSKMTALAAAFLLAASFLQPGMTCAAEKKVEVRFSAYYPAHYTMFKAGWKPWQEQVEKETNGQITFKNYLNGVLNAAAHGFRATKSDICDISTGYPSYVRGSFNLAHVNDLPFMFPRSYIGPLVIETLYAKYIKEEYEKMGVYLAVWLNSSGFNLISKKPVRKLEDLKGMKIRSIGGVCNEYLEALGAVPVSLQNSETYTALQTGVIDGALSCSGPADTMKLWETSKYLTKLNIMNMAIPFAMNKKFFDGLSPDQKKYLYNKLRVASQLISQCYEQEEAEAESNMQKHGVEIIILSDAEMDRIHKAVEPVVANFVKVNEAKGLPAQQLMDDIAALREKYKDLTPEQAMDLVTREPIQGIIDF